MAEIPRSTRVSNRHGLAPLELVMAIPLVMFVLALSVIMGTVSCWKVRGECVARDAIFARRWPRGGPYDPRSLEWRVTSAMKVDQAGPPLPELNSPVFQNPIIRGPLPGIRVDSQMLDPTLHARVGTAQLTRAPPTLKRLGSYSLNVQDFLIDGKWQFWQLGYGSNTSRRMRRLYDVLNIAAASGQKSQYLQAQQQTIAVYMQPPFFVLDRDDEFLAWYGSSRDFHPRLGIPCTLDVDLVQLSVERFLPRIDGQPRPASGRSRPSSVPKTMTSAFLAMYRQQLQVLQNTPPPLTPQQQAQTAALKQKIQILNDFLTTLN